MIRQTIWGFKLLNIFQNFSYWRTCKPKVFSFSFFFSSPKESDLAFARTKNSLCFLLDIRKKNSLNWSEKLTRWVTSQREHVLSKAFSRAKWHTCTRQPCRAALTPDTGERSAVRLSCPMAHAPAEHHGRRCKRGRGRGAPAQTRDVFWGNTPPSLRQGTWTFLLQKHASPPGRWRGFSQYPTERLDRFCPLFSFGQWEAERCAAGSGGAEGSPQHLGWLLGRVKQPQASRPARCQRLGLQRSFQLSKAAAFQGANPEANLSSPASWMRCLEGFLL